jgi:radical SAM family uncharacterized protein
VLPLVSKPARYVGNEVNIVRKDPASVDVHMAISYPDVYEIAMSNLGIRIIYDAVNRIRNFYCERVFSPWTDFEKQLREKSIPLYSLETFTPLSDFDVVGFSVGSELLYTNILGILDLGMIPILSKERKEKDPLIIAGGPAVVNPEPIADFIDVFILGDGETAITDFLTLLLAMKGESRKRLLYELNGFGFTYIPALYTQTEKGGIQFTDVDKVVRRKIEPDLDELPFPVAPIVPLIKIVQDRACIEVSRGCANGCRFCQAGYTYRPVRERSLSGLLRIVEETVENTGYDEVSLLSLSIGDYSCLKELVRLITGRFSENRVSLSLPSLRVNSTNTDILEEVGKVRKSGLTFAVESADPAVQGGLNKPIDVSQLREIVLWAVQAGWRHIKLYFMIGLPLAEREGENIHCFVNDLLGISKRLTINLNIAAFVPKPHTPFERERQVGMEEAKGIIEMTRKRFNDARVKLKFQDPRMSLIEGILSRGDRRVGALVREAYKAGERFSSWDEVFDYKLWQKAMERLGIEKERYLVFSDAGRLPWEFIHCGVTREFLEEERRKSYSSSVTDSCLGGSCAGCGVCDEDAGTDLAKGKRRGGRKTEMPQGIEAPSSSLRYKILFRFTKTEDFRFISHLDLVGYLIRIGNRAGIPFKYSEGFNPKPRLVLPFPLALGLESTYELGEVLLERAIPIEDFIRRYNDLLDSCVRIGEAEVDRRKRSIAGEVFFHDYTVALQDMNSESIGSLVSGLKDQGITEKDCRNLEPEPCFSIKENDLFIRLGPKQSIKRMLEGYEKFTIKRTMIWGLWDGTIDKFFQGTVMVKNRVNGTKHR